MLSSAHSPYPPTPQEEAVWGDLSLREVKRLPEAMAESRLESKFLKIPERRLVTPEAVRHFSRIKWTVYKCNLGIGTRRGLNKCELPGGVMVDA